MRKIISLSLLSILAACGGGGGNSGDSTTTPPGNSGLPPSSTLANLCANPRANTSDRQGTVENEKSYLRSFVDETYLWYADIPSNIVAANYATPQLYFDVLKTNAKTNSGASVDQFHWSQTTASWNAASSGIAQDYGIKWMAKGTAPSRMFLAADVAPGSPAALAGIKRGDIITSIDGVVATEATPDGVAALNEILSPTKVVAHKLGFNGAAEISLTPATYSTSTVLNVKTIPTASGTVGYFIFDTHIAKSEAELIAAIKQLKAANVTDLVIDLRYNGGGLLYVASQLAYMIAGPATTNGQIFEKLTYNDKLAAKNTVYPFYAVTTTNEQLPYLGLKRVTLLVTRNTASASESIINSLRGVDVAVDLIGDLTRGKPYGFVPQDNCSYTYFAIQFKGVNQKGFGDYADGFSPTCKASDDVTHLRGDANETMLKTALSYRQTGLCPANSAGASVLGAEPGYELIRPASQEMRILAAMPH